MLLQLHQKNFHALTFDNTSETSVETNFKSLFAQKIQNKVISPNKNHWSQF